MDEIFAIAFQKRQFKETAVEMVNLPKKIGVAGFEPTASCSQGKRSSQAELHPDDPTKLILDMPETSHTPPGFMVRKRPGGMTPFYFRSDSINRSNSSFVSNEIMIEPLSFSLIRISTRVASRWRSSVSTL